MASSEFIARNCSVPKSVSFEMFSSDEIRKMGVVQVVTPLVLSATGQGLPGGLYDPAMGCHNRLENCKTCQKSLLQCSGHFGFIELPLPVINPLFSKTVLQILRLTCITCNSVIIPVAQKHLAITQLKLLDHGLLEDALEAEQVLAALIDQEAALEEDAKKRNRVSLDVRIVMERFSTFLEERMMGHNEKFEENCRGVEALRNSVIKRVLRFAQINYKCPHCSTVCKRIVQDQSRILYSVCQVDENPEEEETSLGATKMSQKYLTPSEAKIHMQVLWSKEKDFMQHVFPVIRAAKTKFPTDVFFIETLAVPPPKNRPSQTANNITVEHPLNVALRYVVGSCSMMQYLVRAMKEGVESLQPDMKRAVESSPGETFEEKLGKVWNELQTHVDHVMDRDKPQTSVSSQIIGLKQVIEKKEGLFRMNMMGKRVNYAARTVITPDPNINIDEIGIPDAFARTLTFPCTVTPANVYHLRQLILNGPLEHPGAMSVRDENGTLINLTTDRSSRERVANRLLVADKLLTQSKFPGVKTVYRHLQNGDLLLLNRQPSLHRPSIMAHRARVLQGEKVFRLHYANCKHYNADFDGDEMNAHFPQDEESRAEALSLVSVCNHFLVPKDGTPLAGLIQDHIVGAVKLTVRGRFFEEQEYQELIFFALGNRHFTIRMEPPAILLPVPLWSGKQVVSTIVKNLIPHNKPFLTFTSNTKIKAKDWQNQLNRVPYHRFKRMDPNEMSEAEVIFREGEMLCGVLDKVHLGATPNGLCHAFYEVYGSQAVGLLLSAFSRLLTSFLQKEGFTLGIKDVMVAAAADEGREETIVDGRELGLRAAASAFGLSKSTDSARIEARLKQAHRSGDPKARAGVDAAYKKLMDKVTNAVTSECIPYGLTEIFPHNNLQLMVLSGAKGSAVNALQMSCLLGQIELEGKRPPLTLAGKSLPSFRPYDPSPRAGGFIFGRFLTGIRPQEFFFHCMAGREGLIDTAVKTSRSGYLQRCLVKLLEGVVTQYDMTVRDSDGCVVQFLYGEDGLDVCKAQYLKSKQMNFLEQNSKSFPVCIPTSTPEQVQKSEAIDSMKQEVNRWKNSKGTRSSNGFLYFSRKQAKKFRHLTNYNTSTGRSFKSEALETVWRNLSDEEQALYNKKGGKVPEPVLGTYLPSSFGVISEELQKTIDNYSKDQMFRNMVYSKAMESLSNPGDAVGVIAAQSVGEPSTQMTLNTFHFAGRGEMNVTLGIPRLREILMIASENIRTPCMDIPFKDHVTYPEAQKLRIKLTRVTMAQVLEEVEVTEILNNSGDRSYALKFIFLPYKEYRDVFCVNPQSVLTYVERTFIPKRLIPAVQKALSLGKSFKIHMGKDLSNKKSSGLNFNGEDDGDDADSPNVFKHTDDHEKKGQGEEHESSDEEEMAEDADATESRRAGKQHETGYEEPELEELDQYDDDSSEYGSYQAMRSDLEEPDSEDETVMRRVVRSFAVTDAAYRARLELVGNVGGSVDSYSFDKQKQEWCTVVVSPPSWAPKLNVTYVLKELADKCVIHQVPKISRAFLEVTPSKELRLKTEGINILAMAEYQEILDLNRFHCNNIHTMARHYGVEAALKVLIKELTDVFKAYGIVIDPRHLSLIADFMMTSGTYRPFNRLGIGSSTSPLHQMSFETVVNFLREAALGGKRDDLQNPSACLIAGKLVKVGTELFDCFASPPLPKKKTHFGLSSNSDSIYDRIHTTGVKKVYTPFTNGNENGYDPYSYLSTTKTKTIKRETSFY